MKYNFYKSVKKIWAIMTTAMMITGVCTVTACAENVSTEVKEDVDSIDTTIVLNNAQTTITGDNAEFKDNILTIKAGGCYKLSGSLENGQLVIDSEDDVEIILAGVTITNNNGPAIYGKNGDMSIKALKNTENVLSDGAEYTEQDESEEPNACVFSHDRITIKGGGKLTVNGNFEDGIASKDEVKINNSYLTVTAVDDGIRGKDFVELNGGEVIINANGGDGIKSTKGYILVNGGSYTITSTKKGFESADTFTINGGNINVLNCTEGIEAIDIIINDGNIKINASDDGLNASDGSGGDMGMFGFGMQPPQKPNGENGEMERPQKPNGENGEMERPQMPNGENGEMQPPQKPNGENGEMQPPQMPNGENGEMQPPQMPNGENGEMQPPQMPNNENGKMERPQMPNNEMKNKFNGGKFNSNLAEERTENVTEENLESVSEATLEADEEKRACSIEINGGYVWINAKGDGIDSNGSLTFNGGTVFVNGPTSNGDGALDADGEISYNGGLVLAVGSSGMAEAPGTKTSQGYSISYKGEEINAGELVAITNENDEVLAVFKPEKNIGSIVFCSEEITENSTIKIYTGGEYNGELSEDNFGNGGTYSNGTLLEEIKISGKTTSVGTVTGSFEMRGHGGMRNHFEEKTEEATTSENK